MASVVFRRLAAFVFAIALLVSRPAFAGPPPTAAHWIWLDGPLDAFDTWKSRSEARAQEVEAETKAQVTKLQETARHDSEVAFAKARQRFEDLRKTAAPNSPAADLPANGVQGPVGDPAAELAAVRAALLREVDARYPNSYARTIARNAVDQIANDASREIQRIRFDATSQGTALQRSASVELTQLKKSAPLSEPDLKRLAATRHFRGVLEKAIPADVLSGGQGGQLFDNGLFVEMLSHGFSRLPPKDMEALAKKTSELTDQHADAGLLLRSVLGNLGPGFIKLGQFLANRPDLVHVKYRGELAKLSDEAVSMPIDRFRAIVEDSFAANAVLRRLVAGKEVPYASRKKLVDGVFSSIDKTPAGTGSMGQTHLATLRDGRRVAIKVLKPGVKVALFDNLSSMETVVNGHEQGGGAGKAFLALVGEIRRLAEHETDLRHEASTIREMGPQLERDGVLVPRVDGGLSSEQVLVEEVARGTKIKSAALNPDVASKVSERLMASLLRQVLVYGRFHDDPHEGNVFVDEQGTVTLLDWGLSSRITAGERFSLGALVTSLGMGKSGWTERIARGLASGVSASVIHASVERASRSGGSAFARAQDLLLDLQLQGADLPPSLVQASKALLLADGVARKVDPSWDAARGVAAFRRDLVARPLSLFQRPSAPANEPEIERLETRYREELVKEIGELGDPLKHHADAEKSRANARLNEILEDPRFRTSKDRAPREQARVTLANGLLQRLAEEHAEAVSNGWNTQPKLDRARSLQADPALRSDASVEKVFDAAVKERLAMVEARQKVTGFHSKELIAAEKATLTKFLANRQRYASPTPTAAQAR